MPSHPLLHGKRAVVFGAGGSIGSDEGDGPAIPRPVPSGTSGAGLRDYLIVQANEYSMANHAGGPSSRPRSRLPGNRFELSVDMGPPRS